jgi:hypothetical protein
MVYGLFRVYFTRWETLLLLLLYRRGFSVRLGDKVILTPLPKKNGTSAS